MLENKTILLISPEAWGANFVSKHHYANYLAKKNIVFFLNPAQESTIHPFGDTNAQITKIKHNLFQINYQNLIPKLNSLPKTIQKWYYKKQAEQIKIKIGIDKFDIIWSFDPYRFWNQQVWKAEKTIYHTVDFHSKAKYEYEICQNSSHIFGVTPLIINPLKKYTNQIKRIGHGADIDNFSINSSLSLPGTNKIKACYTGNFHKHIDYSLLIELATKNDDIDFIMIGPLLNNNLSNSDQVEKYNLEKLMNIKNIYLIGSVPSHDLMTYLSLCDINLVLFKKEHEVIHCSPHKLMAYFYSGNVTISNYIDEHKLTDSKIIIMLDVLKDIIEKIKEVKMYLNKYNSEDLKKKRKQFAIKNSYDSKIEEIAKLIYSK